MGGWGTATIVIPDLIRDPSLRPPHGPRIKSAVTKSEISHGFPTGRVNVRNPAHGGRSQPPVGAVMAAAAASNPPLNRCDSAASGIALNA